MKIVLQAFWINEYIKINGTRLTWKKQSVFWTAMSKFKTRDKRFCCWRRVLSMLLTLFLNSNVWLKNDAGNLQMKTTKPKSKKGIRIIIMNVRTDRVKRAPIDFVRAYVSSLVLGIPKSQFIEDAQTGIKHFIDIPDTVLVQSIRVSITFWISLHLLVKNR